MAVEAAYLETSALLAWLLGESRGDQARSQIDAADRVVTSVLTLTEARRAMLRAQQKGRLESPHRLRLLSLLGRVQRQWTLMEVSAEVRARAEQAFPVEPVRTLDTLHLSTALAFLRVYPELRLISFDERLIANAQELGIGA